MENKTALKHLNSYNALNYKNDLRQKLDYLGKPRLEYFVRLLTFIAFLLALQCD